MHYYQLSFYYPGPTVNIPSDSECSRDASQANFDADDAISLRVKTAKLEMRHAYAWPDGSLYKYIRTPQKTSLEDF